MQEFQHVYKADKGKQFVLVNVPSFEENAILSSYKEGYVIGEYVEKRDVDAGYVEEVDIPGWTTLTGYQVVFYHNGYRLSAGNPQTFPTQKIAEAYKKYYASRPWCKEQLFVEKVEYEGVPLSASRTYNGKEVIDEEHFFGLDVCEIGDYFTEDMVDQFMDMLPFACMRSDCSQIGEAVAWRIDENGETKTTYATFKKIDEDIWEYCGDCFRGENVRRGIEIPYV